MPCDLNCVRGSHITYYMKFSDLTNLSLINDIPVSARHLCSQSWLHLWLWHVFLWSNQLCIQILSFSYPRHPSNSLSFSSLYSHSSCKFTCLQQTWLLQFTLLWHLTNKSQQTSTHSKFICSCHYKHFKISTHHTNTQKTTLASYQTKNRLQNLSSKIDDCLKFDVHISCLVKKAHQRLAVLFKGFSSRDPAILTMAYKVYIRPILEYCSEVWSPYLLKHIDEIENIQRYFTRKIPGLSSFNYENRLFILGLDSLEMCRIKRDLKMCFKIFYGFVDLDINSFFKLSDATLTRGHHFIIMLNHWFNQIWDFLWICWFRY